MPAGVHGTVQVDRLLTTLSVSLADDSKNFIGPLVAPTVLMDNPGGPYPFFGREEFKLGADDDYVADRGEAKTYEPSMSTDTYTTKGHAEKVILTVAEQRRAQKPFEVLITPRLAEVVRRQKRRHEIKVATLLQTAGNYHANNQIDIDALANRRWDETAATPLVDIETAIAQIELSIGEPPTHMIMPRLVYNAFRNVAAVRAAIKGDKGGAIDKPAIADYFGLKAVLVGGGAVDSAKKGQAAVRGRIWNGKHCMLIYVTESPGRKVATTAYTFVWNAIEGAQDGRVVTRWFEPNLGPLGADVARVANYHDVKAVGVDAPATGKIISGYHIGKVIG